jgi:hypothetical protein
MTIWVLSLFVLNYLKLNIKPEPKPVAHAARAPQVLALVFNYAQLLNTG